MHSRGAWIALSFITGLLMIVLGILFLVRPGLSLASVLLLLGIFAVVYGVALAAAGLLGHAESRGWAIAVGLVAVIFGIMVLVWPGLTALTLIYIIAAWAIISGITDIAGAFIGGLSGGQRAWLILLGVLSLAIGVVFFVHPAKGALALLWLVGIYFVLLGILRIADGFTRPPSVQAA